MIGGGPNKRSRRFRFYGELLWPAVLKRSATSSVGEAHSPFEITLHKAGVVRDGLMAAAVTLVPVSAERGRAAALDGSEHFQLWPGEELTATIQESVASLADDVGHLPGWPFHG